MIRRVLTIIVLVAVVLFSAVFASRNTQTISIDLLFYEYEIAQSVVIVTAVILGVLIGLLIASLFVLRGIAERRRLRKRLSAAETEISTLRSLPLHDAD